MAKWSPNHQWLLHWTLLILLPKLSHAGSMAAWWTDLGPSVVLQNATTGLLTHSICHSNDTPIFPLDPPLAFETTYAPKNGTPLAGTGWFAPPLTWASLFYLNTNDDIVNAVYRCDNATGRYGHIESKVISDRAGTPALHPQTGLSVALLGEQEGYRVFFQDRSKKLQSLKFTQVESWSYGGVISPNTNRTGFAIHSMFSGVRNVTVVTPRDGRNMELSRLNIDGAWHVSTFPTPLRGANITNVSNDTSYPYDTRTAPSFQLESWNGDPAAVGIAIDTQLTRHIFYIGNDSYPHSVAAFVTGTTESGFRAQPNQAPEFWPKARSPNADFAIASDIRTSSIRLYYYADDGSDRLVEARYRNGNWDPAGPLDVRNSSAAATADGAGNGGGGSGSSDGLSTGAKAGIGVGVAVGVLLLGAIAVGLWILRKRKNATATEAAGKDEEEAAVAGAASPGAPMSETAVGSPVPAVGVARTASGVSQEGWDAASDLKEKPASPTARELESPELALELPESGDRTELPAQNMFTELEATEAVRPVVGDAEEKKKG